MSARAAVDAAYLLAAWPGREAGAPVCRARGAPAYRPWLPLATAAANPRGAPRVVHAPETNIVRHLPQDDANAPRPLRPMAQTHRTLRHRVRANQGWAFIACAGNCLQNTGCLLRPDAGACQVSPRMGCPGHASSIARVDTDTTVSMDITPHGRCKALDEGGTPV